jgi:tetratricopeptide (TPR) repeat protein
MVSDNLQNIPENRILRKLRIFVASPRDVATERASITTIIEDLKSLAEYVGVTLELLDWRKVLPDLGRPEQVILDQLKPTMWDLFIGILWHRFGTPSKKSDPKTGKEYLSGTEEEFRMAYRLWQQYKRPRVMFYWCKRNPPFDDLDPVQIQHVKDFFAAFAPDADHPGLFQTFDSYELFESLMRQNLTKFLLEYSEQVNHHVVSKQEIATFIPTVPENLPRRAAFFGREKEIDKVMNALSSEERGWGVVIDGIGGIGKTALAVEAAYLCKECKQFDAFIFVSAKQKRLEPTDIKAETRAVTTLDEFVNNTARALGKTDIVQLASEDKHRAFIETLRSKRVLLIYDNLETLTKEEQEALTDWLRFLPQGCKAILTSRRRGGEGALWLRLEKLDWETAKKIIKHEAKRDTRLEKKLLNFEMRWQELYDTTGGSPLALIHTLGLMRVRITLTFDDALEMLKQGTKREKNLQKFIYEEAHKELGASDLKVLRALSFFIPSATFEALMAVADLSRTPLETVLERLDSLSLVNRELGLERYSLHPLTRTYVRDNLLSDKKVRYEMGMRLARYWVDYANQYGGYKKDSYKTFDRLETEWTNLDAIAQWLWDIAGVKSEVSANNNAARMLADLTSSLSFFLSYSGRWDEHIGLSERAYDVNCDSHDWRNTGWRAFDVAWMNNKRGRTNDAEKWLKKCKESWNREGTKGDQATALRLEGLIALEKKEYDTAQDLLERALNIRRSLRADREIAFALNSLGLLAQKRKQYDLAEQYYTEALQLARKIDDKNGQSIYIGNLGQLALDRRLWTKALKLLEQTLPLAKEVRRMELIADVYYGLARVREATGKPEEGLSLAQDAVKIYEQLQHNDLEKVQKLMERLTKNSKDVNRQ